MVAGVVMALPKVAVSMVFVVEVEPGACGFQFASVTHAPEAALVQVAATKTFVCHNQVSVLSAG